MEIFHAGVVNEWDEALSTSSIGVYLLHNPERQLDIKTALLNGSPEEKAFIKATRRLQD